MLKESLPKAQFLRVARNNSDKHKMEEQIEEMTQKFLERGYRHQELLKAQQEARNANANMQVRKPPAIVFPMTYNDASPKIAKIIKQNWKMLARDDTLPKVFKENPLICFKRNKTLKDIVVHTDPTKSYSQEAAIQHRDNKEHRRIFYTVTMELTKILLLIVAEWTIGLALPVQVFNKAYEETINDLHKEAKTVFELIEAANKDISKPLVHGDIVANTGRGVKNCYSCFWPASPDGVVPVPYVISSVYSSIQKLLITESMKQIELMSCVKFVQRTSQWDYLSLESGNGCWSNVARQGGKQTVSLDKSGCLGSGTIQHELMHSLGFFHEHSRSDRDNHVDIFWKYISDANKFNFNIEDSNNMNLPYDYTSVMHYQNTAFTNTPGHATIAAKGNASLPLGQSIGMSHLDVIKLNKLYNCNVCRVKLMDQSGSFSTDNVSFGQDRSCLWLIQTDSFKLVHLQLSDINIPASAGCSDSYIKVYDGNSKSSSVILDKTCGAGIIPPLISFGNSMLIEFMSNQTPYLSRFNAFYETVSYGGTLTSPSGRIISPSYGKAYPNNIDAEWSIIAPPQSNVFLEFIDFDLQDCSGCSCDSLTIIDGAGSTSPVLGKYCNTDVPDSLTSSGNVMILRFHSDNQTSSVGFFLSYFFGTFSLSGLLDITKAEVPIPP
ncbi:astacin-like metalloendopeptidase [Pelobates fuscus]|uniref:astacin-like metalloendopeptidase n=1 Tax=Pelobates fuscus TaxID=191477 RepID=UPI002FE49D82